MRFIKELLTDESAKYVAAALGWLFILTSIVTGLYFGGFFIPDITLKVIIIVVGIASLLAWMFIGCVAGIRMLRVIEAEE